MGPLSVRCRLVWRWIINITSVATITQPLWGCTSGQDYGGSTSFRTKCCFDLYQASPWKELTTLRQICSKHVQSFKAFFPCPPFFYLSGDSCFLCVFVSGRCTGLLSVVSTGACACPTIHLCPLGWVLSQLSFSLHSSVTVFFPVPYVKCVSACLFSISKLFLCQEAATFIQPLFAQVGTC